MSVNIESHLIENRVFKPTKDFSRRAHISSLEAYRELYRKSIKNPEKFWAEQAVRQVVRWRQAQCFGELSGPAPGRTHAEQGRLDLGRGAGREGNADVSAA